jgi:hypothetical protein
MLGGARWGKNTLKSLNLTNVYPNNNNNNNNNKVKSKPLELRSRVKITTILSQLTFQQIVQSTNLQSFDIENV